MYTPPSPHYFLLANDWQTYLLWLSARLFHNKALFNECLSCPQNSTYSKKKSSFFTFKEAQESDWTQIKIEALNSSERNSHMKTRQRRKVQLVVSPDRKRSEINNRRCFLYSQISPSCGSFSPQSSERGYWLMALSRSGWISISSPCRQDAQHISMSQIKTRQK